MWSQQDETMRKAIGFLIILWGLKVFFTSSFSALDRTGTAVLEAIEVSATATKEQVEERVR